MNHFFSEIKDRYILFFLLLISSLCYWRWFSFDIFTFADYGFKFSNTILDYSNLSSWVYRSGNGGVDILLWRTPFLMFQSMFGHFGYALNVAEKFTLMWVWVFLPPIASYYLVKKVSNSKLGGFIGSIIFCYNTYYLAINSVGHFNISVASAFGVLAFYFMLRMYESGKLSHIVFTSLSLLFCGVYDLRVLYLISSGFALYFLINVFSNTKKLKKVFVQTLVINFKLFTITAVLSAYWLIPTVLVGSYSDSPTLHRGLFGDDFWNLKSAFMLFHPFWNGSEVEWFKVSQPPNYLYLIPLIAIMGFVFGRKNNRVIFFGLLAFTGVFLAKQQDPPFGLVYLFLFDNFPGFNAFRESTKFYTLIAIGYAVLIGIFYAKLFHSYSKNQLIRLIVLILALIPIVIFANNAYTIVSGRIGSTHVPRTYPYEFERVDLFINSQEEYFRTLLIPTVPHPWTYTSTHPRMSMANMADNDWREYFSTSSAELTLNDRMFEILNHPSANNLLDQSSVKYVVVPKRGDIPRDDIFKFYGEDRDYYINRVSEIPYLRRVDFYNNETLFFVNENFRPHIYITRSEESLDQDNEFIPVEFRRDGLFGYELEINDISDSFYIHLTENFHPKWRVIGGELGVNSFNNIFPKRYHIKSEAGMNSFFIDSQYVKENFSTDVYTSNPDGSSNYRFILIYYPDIFLFLGIVVSLSGLILLCIYLVFDTKKGKSKNKV